ncbi:unnamed protein product [Penicillium nalgiovense]|nr:unnamed protein product [Penicillium nalgiovense]
MPRPRIDLEPFKAEILDLLSTNVTHTAIRATLEEKYSIIVSPSTLKRSLTVWSPLTSRNNRNTTTRINFRDRVSKLLPLYNTQDILRILTSEGIHSLERTLYRIRADLRITLRLTPKQR